jgi:hypothetical protein
VDAANEIRENPKCSPNAHNAILGGRKIVSQPTKFHRSIRRVSIVAAARIHCAQWMERAFFLLCDASQTLFLLAVGIFLLIVVLVRWVRAVCHTAVAAQPTKEIELWCRLENIIYSHAPQLQHAPTVWHGAHTPWVQKLGGRAFHFSFLSQARVQFAAQQMAQIALFIVYSALCRPSVLASFRNMCRLFMRAFAHWARGKLKIISRCRKAPGDYC